MRGATQCARRLKQLVRSLRTNLGKVGSPAAGDAITQMILGILSRDVPESKAREALDRLRAAVVDYNELRVVPPIEMTETVGALSDARLKCEDLSRALNKVFTHEHEVSLERLSGLPRKDVVEYLESIDGLDAYSRARVRLLGLQQHAVPLDEAMWAYARKMQIVNRRCPLQEAQAFLERRIPEGEALEFTALLEKQAWVEMGAAVRDGEVERITSIPPDRTARNMLQLVASGRETAASLSRPKTGEAGGTAALGGEKGAPGAKTIGGDRPLTQRQPRSSFGRVATAELRSGRCVKGRVPSPGPNRDRKRADAAKKLAKEPEATRAAAKAPTRAVAKGKVKPKRRAKRESKPAARGKSKTHRTMRTNAARRTRRSSARAKSA